MQIPHLPSFLDLPLFVDHFVLQLLHIMSLQLTFFLQIAVWINTIFKFVKLQFGATCLQFIVWEHFSCKLNFSPKGWLGIAKLKPLVERYSCHPMRSLDTSNNLSVGPSCMWRTWNSWLCYLVSNTAGRRPGWEEQRDREKQGERRRLFKDKASLLVSIFLWWFS